MSKELQGLTLETILTRLQCHYGWDGLSKHIDIGKTGCGIGQLVQGKRRPDAQEWRLVPQQIAVARRQRRCAATVP